CIPSNQQFHRLAPNRLALLTFNFLDSSTGVHNIICTLCTEMGEPSTCAWRFDQEVTGKDLGLKAFGQASGPWVKRRTAGNRNVVVGQWITLQTACVKIF